MARGTYRDAPRRRAQDSGEWQDFEGASPGSLAAGLTAAKSSAPKPKPAPKAPPPPRDDALSALWQDAMKEQTSARPKGGEAPVGARLRATASGAEGEADRE